MPAPTLIRQTTYAELLERCSAAAFDASFLEPGSFTSKLVNERKYWYFQTPGKEGRAQRYVGPETPQLLERIEQHRHHHDDEKARRALVATLVRSFGLPAPMDRIGEVLGGLSRAGVFRLRGVLVGTVAYQAYPAMLGEKLPGALLQTSDIDVAQFRSVSVAVGDQTVPMLEVLKGVDPTFREVPPLRRQAGVSSFKAKDGLRVDFLTPNEGPDTDEPQELPALRTAGQPLRFLDFLIHDAIPAVMLHGSGVLVSVPTPERYAVHKLILTSRRPASAAKSDKDLLQAAALLKFLAGKRPRDLKIVWDEAYARGPKWRQLLLTGLGQLAPQTRDIALKCLHLNRGTLPMADLVFDNPVLRHDASREIVFFSGHGLGGTVRCSVSREALEDHFGAGAGTKAALVDAAQRHRSVIENLLRTKYLEAPVEEAGEVLLRTADVEALSTHQRGHS